MARIKHGMPGIYNSSPLTLSNEEGAALGLDANGNVLTSSATASAGEDVTTDVQKVEERFSYARVVADGLVKTGAGFVHTVTFSATGAVTAGVITLYDNTSEAGTAIWSGTIQTGLNPLTITLDVVFSTGLYIGYDATIANVATTASYR